MADIGKTLVRRLMGKKGGGRPTPIYTHPHFDKVGPKSMMSNIGTTLMMKPKKGGY